MLRLIVTGLLSIGLLWPLQFAEAQQQSGASVAKLVQSIKDIHARTNMIRGALSALDKSLKGTMPASMVDDKALEQLSADVGGLNGIATGPLSPLNTKERIREIGGKAETTGAAQVQLERLKQASNQRKKEIEDIRSALRDLKSVRDNYAETLRVAEKTAEAVSKHIGNPAVEFAARLSGKSYVLSAADLMLNLVPALQERLDAADAAISRLEKVIGQAENDLRGFDESRAFALQIFSGIPDKPSSFGGGGPVVSPIQDIENRMIEGTRQTQALAQSLEKEASSIRQHNARLSKIQALAAIVGQGASYAGADTTERGKPSPAINHYSITYIKIEQKWEVHQQSTP